MRGIVHTAHAVHGMTFEWPAGKVDLNRASELFAKAGRAASRSSLSRFVKNRDFAHEQAGQRKLVDAKALFEAFFNDFTRETMAGENGLAARAFRNSAPAPRETGARHDPRREFHELKAEELRIDMAQRKGELVPAEEAAAAVAESVANLRSALNEAINDTAEALIHALALPAHRHALVVKALKDFAHSGQVKFAATFEPLMAKITPTGTPPPDFLADLVAYVIHLREGGADQSEKFDWTEPSAADAAS